jgi:hypothetical protein
MWCGRSESQAAAAMRRRGHVARALVFEEATPIRAQGERGASGSEGAARAGGGGGDGGGCEARAVAREEVRTPREQRLRLEQAAAARETQRLHDEQLLNELQRRIAVLERTLHEPSQPCAEAEAAAAAAWEAKLAAEALRKQQQQRQADRAAEEAAEAELAAAKAAALAEARRAERERLDAESGALQAKAQEPVEAMDGYSDFAAAIGGGGGGDGGDRGGDEQVPSPRQRYRSRYRAASSVAGTVQGDDEFFGSNDGSLIPAERRTLDRMLRGSRLLDTDAGVRDELRDAHAAVREAKLAAEALRKQQQQRQADRAAEEAAEAELAAAKAAALAEARRAERERLDAESGALQAKAQEPVEAMDGYSDFAAAIGGGGGGDGGDRGGDEQVPSPRQRYRSRYRAGSSVMGDDEIFGGDGGSLIPAERRTLGRMLRPSRLLDSDAGLRDELPGAQAVVAAVPPPEQNCLDDSESTLQRFRTQLDTAREAVGLAVRTLVGPELRA